MKKTKILSIFASLLVMMSAVVLYSCSETSNEVAPSPIPAKRSPNNKSEIRSNSGTFIAPEDMRASMPVEELEGTFEHNNTVYKVVVRHNESENKIYDFTLSYVSGTPVEINNPSGNPSLQMTPKEFWDRIYGCVEAKSMKCVFKTILDAISDCEEHGGSHCWMYK